MTPEQFSQFQEAITNQIKITVNGKIDRINDKLDTYIKEDNEWKSDVKPYIENMRQISNFSTVGSAILKTIIAFGAAITVIWAAIKYLKY